MAKKKDKVKIKQEIRAAGPTISKSEMDRIVKAAGGNKAKALNRISSVQENMKEKDMRAPSIGSAAANLLIKQASTPVGRSSLGSSSAAQAISSMAGSPAGPMRQGQQTPATPGTRITAGNVLRPSGREGTKQAPKISSAGPTEDPVAGKPPAEFDTTPAATIDSTEPVNPLQDAVDSILGDSILGDSATTPTEQTDQSQYFQDIINQNQAQYEQRVSELSDMYNQQLMGIQDMYNMQIQQANARALADKEATRALMINQGRMMSPANLQLGIGYNQNRLAGTAGFKVRPTQANFDPIAFSGPTLSTSAASQVPNILNV